MGIIISEQNTAFFVAVILGFFLGLFYEGFRILRVAFPHNGFFIGTEDFFFCITCAICLILLSYAYASGVIRWFTVAGMLIGALCYFFTLGKLISSCAKKLISLLKKALLFVAELTISPIVRMIKQFASALAQWKAKRTDKRIRHKLQTKL